MLLMSEARSRADEWGAADDRPAELAGAIWSPPRDPLDSDVVAEDWAFAGDAPQTGEAQGQPGVGWLARLLGLRRRAVLSARIQQLDQAVERTSGSPTAYVLRGEAYLALGERAAAAADFRQALALAEADYAASDWGLVGQAMQDRAIEGLRRAR